MFSVKGLIKDDLWIVAEEFGLTITPELMVSELKELITNSDEMKKDKDFVKEFIITTVSTRKEKEEPNKQVELAKAQNDESKAENIEQSFRHMSMVETIKNVRTLTIPCPTKPELWNLFFNNLERAFVTKKLPEEHKAEILINFLGAKAANILIYLDNDNIKEYETLKSIILSEYKSSA